MWNDPEVFGGFLLVRRLADSAMASVSLAVRLADSSGKTIVVKRPPLGERASGRAAQAILREAEVLSAVRGAGVPLLEAAGDIAGLPYVAVERLRGANLAKVLALGEALPAAAVRAIGRDVARALERLHEAGWVHRDVTPSNVFIDEAGEAYLLDFGLCERTGDERGAPLAGTRGYAAPEAPTARAAHPAQDVYGLAVCLAEAALGRRLFDEAHLVEAAARGDAPPQIAALEGRIPGLVAALRRDPSARPTAAGFAESLAGAAPAPGEPNGSSTLAALAERAQANPGLPPVRAFTPVHVEPEPPESAHTARAESGLSGRAESAVAVRAEGALSARAEGALAPVRPAEASVSLPENPFAARSPQPALHGPPRAVTPTVAMPAVHVREVPFRDSGVVDTVRDLASDAPPALRGTAPRSRGAAGDPRVWQAAALAAVVALLIGFVSGRFAARANRGASFAIVGALPKRAELYLDTKKLTVADGVPMPIPAGSHTITIALPKNQKREIPFTAHPGEHVVIVSPLGKGASSDDDPTP